MYNIKFILKYSEITKLESHSIMTLPENEKKSEKKEKPLTKVIIRRLPPSMDQETFLSQVSPVPDYNYIYTVKGDSSLGEYAFSRVYINFVNPDDIFSFKERFDNYVFLDNKGHEYPAVVEFASFQKIPKKRGKIRMDPKCGTIETDPLYIEFVESLNKPQELDEKPEYTLQLTNENKDDVTTPLLEYIKNKRAQRMRIREVRREERKRREFDRKKDRYDDCRRLNEEKSPLKASTVKSQPVKTSGIKEEKDEGETNTENKVEEKIEKSEKVYEKSSSFYKNKERKYEERRKDIKPRFPRKEYSENRDYKRSDDYKEKDYRSKYDDYKKDSDTRSFTKKVKKYSEKREERKMEVQKAEQKKLDQAKEVKPEKDETKSTESKNVEITDASAKTKSEEKESKNKESDSQKRIRNKDRPTIAIYRPGMLSKRKQNEGEPEVKEGKVEGKN
ncbi:regulator of nonsense transcripts 3B [Anoplophora glabripennis]|uniref:regulator of nonsense transcripts 3B n=1 Tax=Anoplophora glabripennis TaxID=217634 RepID=UPI000874F4EE|nr:regulator of nonsense transcripts 3B [Anoplophora glabripennis]